MSLVDVIGWSATCVGALLALPQLLRLVRTRHLEGVSLFAWRAVLVLNIIWMAHGIRIGQPPQIVTNVIALCITLPILVVLSRSLGRSLLMVLAPPLAAAAIVVGIDVYLGSLAFGIAAIIPGIFSNAGQSVELVRSGDVRGVAPLFLMMAVLNQVLWLTWALMVRDPGTIFAAAITLAMTAFNLTWYSLRRFGLRAFFVREPLPAPQVSRTPALVRG